MSNSVQLVTESVAGSTYSQLEFVSRLIPWGEGASVYLRVQLFSETDPTESPAGTVTLSSLKFAAAAVHSAMVWKEWCSIASLASSCVSSSDIL